MTFFIPLAYIGPGAGLGLIMALLGLATAVGAALFSVLLWPLRNLMKRRGQVATHRDPGNSN